MANLSARQSEFNTAIADLRTVVANATTDVNAQDSDRVEIQRLKGRALAGLAAMGLPVGPTHA